MCFRLWKGHFIFIRNEKKVVFRGVLQVGADAARPKVTVPKEPNLETANRAQRRRYIHFLRGFSKIFCLIYEGLPTELITL